MKYILAILILIFATTSCVTTSLPPPVPPAEKELITVVIYLTSWCGWCKTAKRFLKERNIPYIEKNFSDPKEYQELVKIAERLNYKGKLNAVPLFIVKNTIIVGFNPKEILCLLGTQKCSLEFYERAATKLE